MKFGLEQHIIDKLISVFEQNSKVDKAYIFGSRAKGNYRPDSDIDIAIKGSDITTDDIISMSVAFESKGINYKIDLINYHSIKEPDLKEHIDRVGIEFYSRWADCKLGDVLEVKYGKDHKELGAGLIPAFGSGGIMRYVDKSLYDKSSILIPRKGTLNNIFYRDEPFWTVDTLFWTKINEAIAFPKFLFYQLKTIDYNNLNVGTAVPSLTVPVIQSIGISLPPLSEQIDIASILSCLDDKIDLLENQNKTLIKLAETLFRKWFIEDAIFTETLGDYVVTANTGLDAIKRAPIVEYETGIKCLRIQDVSQHKPIKKWGHSKVEENNFKKFQLKRDDIIMARTCSPGINYFVREDLPAVFNNGLVRIRAKKERVNPILLYYLFKTRDFIGHIDAISGGTSVQLNMQVGQLLSYEFSFPSIEKQNEIIESFIAFDNKTFENNNQIESLIELRDTLLPKLVSGEVRISELKAVAN